MPTHDSVQSRVLENTLLTLRVPADFTTRAIIAFSTAFLLSGFTSCQTPTTVKIHYRYCASS